MNVSVVISTCGNTDWADLAWSRAYPSAAAQEPQPEIIVEHYPAAYSVAWARNQAAQQAKGDWLCFLDADDELCPGYLTAMAAAYPPLTHWRVPGDPRSLLVPAVSYLHPDGRCTDPVIPQRGLWPELNECVVGTLVRRELFERLGGFRELVSLEDYDLWLRCFDAGADLMYVEEAVYCAYVSSSGRNADQSPYAAIWAEHLARVGA